MKSADRYRVETLANGKTVYICRQCERAISRNSLRLHTENHERGR